MAPWIPASRQAHISPLPFSLSLLPSLSSSFLSPPLVFLPPLLSITLYLCACACVCVCVCVKSLSACIVSSVVQTQQVICIMSRSDSEEGPDAKKRKIVRKNTRGRTIYCVHTHTVLNSWTINYYIWNTAGTKVISRMSLQSHMQCCQTLHCLFFCAFENC